MLTLLAFVLTAQPAWSTEAKIKPPTKPFVLSGDAAPTDAVLIVAKKKTTFTLTGPGRLTLTLMGLAEKKGKKVGSAGAVEIKLGKSKAQKVVFPTTLASWSVSKKPKWVVTTPQIVELELKEGPNPIALTPAAGVKLGFGLVVSFAKSAAEPPPVVSTEPPPPPPTPDQPTLAASNADEPPLTDSEPDIMGGPSAVPEPAPVGVEGYTFVGNPPPLTTLSGPTGQEKLLKISINEGLELTAIGPGRMLFDIHAHRDPSQAESIKPVIVGVMIDDVLIQTLSVNQPASPDLKIEGAAYTPSVRVTLRVPIEPGTHRVRLTLSDSAVLGASIRPRFEALSDTEEPSVLSAETARLDDLKATAPLPEVYGNVGVGVAVAGFFPTAFPRAGGMAELDVNFQIPVAGPRLAVGLWGGYGRVDYNRNYPDDRRLSGVSRARLELTIIPIFVEARWSAPIAAPFGVEAGIGGGVLLAQTLDRSSGGTLNPGFNTVGAGVIQVTGFYELGPGALLLKGQFILCQPMKTEAVQSFDAGGATVSLGYRFTFGESNAM